MEERIKQLEEQVEALQFKHKTIKPWLNSQGLFV